MIRPRAIHIVVRPKQPLYLLIISGFIAIGLISAWRIYGAGAWVFAAAYIALSAGFLLDRIVFDGTRFNRRGPGAALLALGGYQTVLSLEGVEAITSYTVPGWRGNPRYNTVISGGEISWVIRSNQSSYARFIKAVFKLVNQHQLDPLSTELLYYWNEPDPAFKLVKDKVINAYRIERWRRKAISLSFIGSNDAAAAYFKLAHENAPHDPQIAYDFGRFLRRRAASHGVRSLAGARDMSHAERYFRMAGRLAWEKKNARLLEKVGEAFLECSQGVSARRYFELATSLEPVRPRANIGLASLALQSCQGARAVHAFNQAAAGAEEEGIKGMAQHARRKADYFTRLLNDDAFLDKEASWSSVQTQLKWVRRCAFGLFLAAWLLHLAAAQINSQIREVGRELSATALIMWVCALTASQVITALRRQD